MECKNPVGESPTSCALVLFEKSNLMHQRKAVCEGDAVFERNVDEILGRMCDDIAINVEVYLLCYQ